MYSIYPQGEGPDTDLILSIEQYLINWKENISFNDIAGLEDAKNVLKLNVIAPLKMKEYFTNIREPAKGLLLYGPAGTGKTMLAKAIANIGGTTFISINPATLASKWKGDSEKMVRILFQMAWFYAPTIMFIDEVDSILSEWSNNEHEANWKVKVQFFIEIDGITKSDELSQ